MNSTAGSTSSRLSMHSVNSNEGTEASEDWTNLASNASDDDEEGVAIISQASLLDSIKVVQEGFYLKPGSVNARITSSERSSTSGKEIFASEHGYDTESQVSDYHEGRVVDDGTDYDTDYGSDASTAYSVYDEKPAATAAFPERIVQPIQAAMDQHVAPHVHKMKQAVHERVTPHVSKVVQDTHEAVQTHVSTLKSSTQKTFATVAQKSQTAASEFQVKTVRPLQQKTQDTVQTLSATSKQVVEDRVVPALRQLQSDTSTQLQSIETSTRSAVNTHIKPQVEQGRRLHGRYAKYYMGSAPAFSSLYLDLSGADDDGGTGARQQIKLACVLLEATFRAFGRVVFCNNPATGLIIFLALVSAHPYLALSAFSCAISVNVMACQLMLDKSKLESGYWATSAVLVGAASVAYFDMVWEWKALVASTLVGAPFTLIATIGLEQKLPTAAPLLHIPYNAVFLVLLMASILWRQVFIVRLVTEDEEEELAWKSTSLTVGIWDSTWCGIAVIFLVPQKAWVGFVVWLAMLFYSRMVAVAILLGSFIASVCAGILVGIPAAYLSTGLFSYNAALTMGALVSYQQYANPSLAIVMIAFFAILLTGIVQSAWTGVFWSIIGLRMPLTIPFCAACLALLTLDLRSAIGPAIRWERRDHPIDVPPEDDSTMSRSGAGEEEQQGSAMEVDTMLLGCSDDSDGGSYGGDPTENTPLLV